jgi:hypothetical protein
MLCGVAALGLGAPPALAVSTSVDGYSYDLPAGADKNLDAVRALIAASNALGMTHLSTLPANLTPRPDRCSANLICLGNNTAAHEYRAHGVWNGAKVDTAVIDFDYRIPAIRADATTGKAVTVTVAANGLAWDESAPGVFSKASTDSVAARLLPVYLLPDAVAYFGGLAADRVKLTTAADGSRVLTIPLPAPLNTNLIATLDAKGLPIHTEIDFGGKHYSGDFASFTNDRMEFDVYGPGRIVLKADGQTLADLDVEWHWTDPYIVSPTPKQLVASAATANASPTQSSAATAPTGAAIPRTSDGHPDFTGIWIPTVALPSGNANTTFAEHSADGGNDAGAGNAVDRGLERRADLNKPIYLPQYWPVVNENDYDGDVEKRDPAFQCLPIGLPQIGSPAEIIQVPERNLIVFRYQTGTTGGRSDSRIIPIDGRPHNPADVVLETFYGDSVGHWEGDTLVIESIGFTDQSWLAKIGYPHGNQMKLTERFTRTADTYTWTATVEDPEYLQSPWTMNPITRTINRDPAAFVPEDLPCIPDPENYVSHTRT